VTTTPLEVKSCCAAAYSSAAARFLLGDSFHPGGSDLTSKLIRRLGVGPGATVVDVASGRGTSSLQLARELGCQVVGVELSPTNVAAAGEAATEAGFSSQARFLVGDAEALPLDDESMDGALCECALCTFPDKEASVRELARVLRPGARLVLADMSAEPERLPETLRNLAAWVACIGDARPADELGALLGGAGFEVEHVERHDDELRRLLDRIEARLRTASLLGGDFLGDGIAQGRELVQAALDALASGSLGYVSMTARSA
jgi:arsenite methyltransferase